MEKPRHTARTVVLAAIISTLIVAVAIYASNGASDKTAASLLDITGYCTPSHCTLTMENRGDSVVYFTQINLTAGDTRLLIPVEPALSVPPLSYGLLEIHLAGPHLHLSYTTGSHIYRLTIDATAAHLPAGTSKLLYTLNHTIDGCSQLIPLELEPYGLFTNRTHAFYIEVNASFSRDAEWADAKLFYMHDLPVWEAFQSNTGTGLNVLLPLQYVPQWRTHGVPSPATRATLSFDLKPGPQGACGGWAVFSVYKTIPVRLRVGLADGSVVEDYIPLVNGTPG